MLHHNDHQNRSRSLYWERGLKFFSLNCFAFSQVSLPVLGAWIEIFFPPLTNNQGEQSLPVLGAWIEIRRNWRNVSKGTSLPVLGAWIEILQVSEISQMIESRSLYWERGLKLNQLNLYRVLHLSLPVLGAWIEIHPCRREQTLSKSLPVLGAWIEIFDSAITS